MSNKKEYTTFMQDKMRVKHDTLARFTVKTGNIVLEDDLTPVEVVGGALVRAGVMYNALSQSGGVHWYNPATGHSIKRPKISIKLRPQDILTGDQECNCERCLA